MTWQVLLVNLLCFLFVKNKHLHLNYKQKQILQTQYLSQIMIVYTSKKFEKLLELKVTLLNPFHGENKVIMCVYIYIHDYINNKLAKH